MLMVRPMSLGSIGISTSKRYEKMGVMLLMLLLQIYVVLICILICYVEVYCCVSICHLHMSRTMHNGC